MGSTTINKKRKLKDVDEAVAATKKTKTKKSKLPPPPEVEEDDDESVASADDEVLDDDEAMGEEEQEGDAAEDSGDEIVDETQPIDGLPNASAPLLPPSTDSDLFEDMNLSEKTMKSITEMGFTKMTAIQKSVSQANCHPPSSSQSPH